jgi:hypothetical protein
VGLDGHRVTEAALDEIAGEFDRSVEGAILPSIAEPGVVRIEYESPGSGE